MCSSTCNGFSRLNGDHHLIVSHSSLCLWISFGSSVHTLRNCQFLTIIKRSNPFGRCEHACSCYHNKIQIMRLFMNLPTSSFMFFSKYRFVCVGDLHTRGSDKIFQQIRSLYISANNSMALSLSR